MNLITQLSRRYQMAMADIRRGSRKKAEAFSGDVKKGSDESEPFCNASFVDVI